MAWFIRTTSRASSRPSRRPIFSRGTVVNLSTISAPEAFSPFSSLGSMRIRKSGASTGFVVKIQIVTDLVASKSSSCTITAGRGFPA
jgi:hypothetical protein